MARENLERLRVLHDEARIRLLECRYNAAEAGCAYQSIDNKLRAEIFAKALPGLINELTPALLLIRGLCELLGQPLYNAEKKICETLKVADIVESVGLIRGRINDIESDASNPLRYCPEKLPDSVSHAIRNAPSPVQWSAARRNPEKCATLRRAENSAGVAVMGGLNISHLHGADIVSRLRELMSRNRLKANTASISDETRRALDNEYQKLERELELHTLHTASGGGNNDGIECYNCTADYVVSQRNQQSQMVFNCAIESITGKHPKDLHFSGDTARYSSEVEPVPRQSATLSSGWQANFLAEITPCLLRINQVRLCW